MTTRGITAWAEAEPDRPALVCSDGDVDRVLTYAEFDERTRRLAAALATRGIGADDRVAIMLPNGFEFFEVWGAATASRPVSPTARC